MTSSEAKAILLLHRPGVPDDPDSRMDEARAVAARDPELAAWFAAHCAFQQALRARLRSAPVPAGLREQLLAAPKVIAPPFWLRTTTWLAAAAAIVLLLAGTALLRSRAVPDQFADFRSRMVRTVLREYRMDILTNDMTQVRQFMAARGAPADYELPPGLAKLSLTGGGRLQWRGHAVSMVCFDRGDREMLYLFVLPRAAAKAQPPEVPQTEQVNRLATVSWSRGDNVYVLAGPAESDFARKYF